MTTRIICLLLFAACLPLFAGESQNRVANVLDQFRKTADANARALNPKAGDALAELCIRDAAGYCEREKIPTKDFLVALGIAFDSADTLRKHPLTRDAFKPYAGERRNLPGTFTMQKRADWLLHFALSAALTAATNPETAEIIGLGKEIQDALGPSGFSFADLAADEAGITFARRLIAQPEPLTEVAKSFTCDAFLPPIADLDENLSLKALTAKYGGPESDAFQTTWRTIKKRVNDQPIYKTWTIDKRK